MKRLFTLILALCSMIGIGAKEINEKQAATIAGKWRAATATRGTGSAKAQLTRVGNSDGGATLAYVFNYSGGEGFVIVAGDDRLGEVLAYSTTGHFDPDNLAPAARAWLNSQKNAVAAVMSGNAALADNNAASADNDDNDADNAASADKDDNAASTDVYDTAVEPLCTSQWGQTEPFNNLCPELENSKGEKEHAVTGCTATAMAQLLYHWKQPATGAGSNTIETYDGQAYTVDFSQSSYDWTSMTDTYDATSDEASRTAVAKLMYDCGVAAYMYYGLQEDGGSGAGEAAAAYALVNNFKMDKGLRIEHANAYRSSEEWRKLVKSELDNERPVFYSGYTPSGIGHAFVCDGYDRAGLFHINWGWEGDGNGYFSLRTLWPDYQGTGGSSLDEGFSTNQLIFTGLKPAEANSEEHPYTMTIDSLAMTVADNASKQLNVKFTKLNNRGYGDFGGSFWFTLYDKDGNRAYEQSLWPGEYCVLEASYQFNDYDTCFNVSSLPNGEYIPYVYTRDGKTGVEEVVRQMKYIYPQTLVVSDDGLTVVKPKYTSAKPESLSASGDADSGYFVEAQFSFANENEQYEYEGVLTLYFLSTDDIEDPDLEYVGSARQQIILSPGQTSDPISFSLAGIQSKTGYLELLDSNTGYIFYFEPIDFSTTGIGSVKSDLGQVVVADLQGRTVFIGKASVESALSGLAAGVYVVKSGKETKKVLVK